LNCHPFAFARQVLSEIKRHCALTNGIHANTAYVLLSNGPENLLTKTQEWKKSGSDPVASSDAKQLRANFKVRLQSFRE